MLTKEHAEQPRPGWVPEAPDLFSATVSCGSERHYLVVERMPDGAWDWAAWGPGATRRKGAQSVNGIAQTAAQAMVAAEHAVTALGADSALLGKTTGGAAG